MNCRGVPSKVCHLKMYILATLYTKRKICNQANIMKLIIPAVELAAGLQLTPKKKLGGRHGSYSSVCIKNVTNYNAQ